MSRSGNSSARGDNERSGSRIHVSHLFRTKDDGEWQLRVWGYLPEGITEVRTVELAGLDLQADGGTHVANTAEVGRIRVTDYKSKGKINKRIYLEVRD